MQKENGFTLTELLIAMIIMLVLAGIGLPTMIYHYARAKQQKAIAQVQRLETALEQFKSDMGYYPVELTEGEYFGTTSTDTSKRAAIIQALSGYDKNQNKVAAWWDDQYWHGPYLEFDKKELDSSGQFIDPWQEAYLFDGTAAGRDLNNTASFDILSKGPDRIWNAGTPGHTDNDDNIVNWLPNYVND
ncbi:MAG: type II secretion system protein GspG [Candidatus Auribacterota bacterium]